MSGTVVFLISSLRGVNTGIGGHYRSVKEIAALLRTSMDVRVVTWGDVPSPVLADEDGYVHVHTSGIFSPSGIRRLRTAVSSICAGSQTKPIRIVSVGWIFSVMAAWLATGRTNVSRIHLRPGGEAARFPWLVDDLPIAVFHQKDAELFTRLSPSRSLALVPGRVTRPAYDPTYLSSADRPFAKTSEDGQSIAAVSVMRVASDKRVPIRLTYQALEAIDPRLATDTLTLVHLGTVQDETLKQYITDRPLAFPFRIVSDALSTSAGPKYLHGHDAFIGIGRGVIEAMALGIPAFIPVPAPGRAPALCAITKENWRAFLRENFTHRVSWAELATSGPVVEFNQFLAEPELRKRLSSEVTEIYELHLSPAASRTAWLTLLQAPQCNRSTRLEVQRLCYVGLLEMKRWVRLLRGRPRNVAGTKDRPCER